MAIIAEDLITEAENDLRALKEMKDKTECVDRVFGFHVQQAIEKSLIAWIINTGVEFPLTHNLARLLAILEENGQDVEQFWDLVEYTAYAVAFRNDADAIAEDPLDRTEALSNTQRLHDHVWGIIDATFTNTLHAILPP